MLFRFSSRMFVHFRISAVCSCCLSDLFWWCILLIIYLSITWQKSCWRKGKSNGCVSSLRCFSCLSLFCSWLVFISGKDWSLVSDSFLLCLLLLYPIVFSTLIDICKEDKADSLVYLIKGISGCCQNVKGFLWYLCLCMDCSGVYSMILLTALLYPGLPFVTVFCLKERRMTLNEENMYKSDLVGERVFMRQLPLRIIKLWTSRFCDVSQTRMDYANRILVNKYGQKSKDMYAITIWATTGWRTAGWSHYYVSRSNASWLYHSCNEKDMMLFAKNLWLSMRKSSRNNNGPKQTGRSLRVTFNYRYAPYHTKIKELIESDVIGDVFSIHFEWLLNTQHGADYFRRWHRNKHNSGGLLVHKSTHHFDLVNFGWTAVPKRYLHSVD